MEKMKLKNKLGISIITPTYNRADELDFLLNSISNQSITLENVQCVISDDGSTDDTKILIKNWQEKAEFEILYISQNNKGPGAARNHGLEKSLGELFSFFILETILLGRALNINPFDQPSVELIKKETKKILIQA